MLANAPVFSISGVMAAEQEKAAWDKAERIKKSEFALRYSIEETNWKVPFYIGEGLRWLAEDVGTNPTTINVSGVMPASVISVQAVAQDALVSTTSASVGTDQPMV